MYQLYFLIETKKSLYIYSLPYNINIKYNFHFAFRNFFNDYEETKKRKKKKKWNPSFQQVWYFSNKTITRESLIPRRIPSFCNYFSITTECNQLQHETLILLFLLMHMAEKIVKTHFTSNILRHTGVVWQWPFISCHDVVSDRIFFDRLWRGKKVVPNGRTKKYVSLYDTKVN